jgi:hypothetical protein
MQVVNDSIFLTRRELLVKIDIMYYGAIPARNAANRPLLNLQNNPLIGKEIEVTRNREAFN